MSTKDGERAHKRRICGVTEIQCPYDTPLGKRLLEDILEIMGKSVDKVEFAGVSFSFTGKGRAKARFG